MPGARTGPMLRSMRGNSKGLVVSGFVPKAATIGEVRLGPVLRVRFHVVPRQYQTDRYRPNFCRSAMRPNLGHSRGRDFRPKAAIDSDLRRWPLRALNPAIRAARVLTQ